MPVLVLEETTGPRRSTGASRYPFPQFRTGIDDLDIHFLIHVPSPHADATPLVMTNTGRPGWVVGFRKVIEPLA